ncbi:tetratricopeptide repeat protein [Frigoriglobus tundricola]|uniref:Type II/III secretion system secretin-like domain-containing protein n=1 Tax=Frigoriglobus tundricola TaxID=2774151 RepID=A0A6M5YHM7_9BACT|nr:tetratricopeptide repeat protein [Frigoriglobus tundricola]QJW93569.1 hypothetical protein FTUN_1076 [Frigoriglobus tundricola]
MRIRTLFAITLTMFALPALGRAQKEAEPSKPTAPVAADDSKHPASAESLVAIADVRLEAALDEKTPGSKEELLDMARTGYQKALAQDPKSKAALTGMARFYARLGDRDRAIEMYKKYLTLYPSDAGVAHEVALAHARWKDWTGAVAWCEFALKIDPENRAVKKTLGFCQAFSGKWDEAFAALCQIMPEAQARHNLAGLLDHMGHADASKAQILLALKADPTYTPACQLLGDMQPVAVVPAPFGGQSPPPVAATNPALSVNFEVRLLKVPVGFCERAGVKLTGDTVLTDKAVFRLLEAAQGQRDANVVQLPKVTADDGQAATVRNTEQQFFTTSVEVMKVKGATVFVPQNKPIELGNVLTLTGHVLADHTRVSVRANLKHTALVGNVELVPVVTKITPVFEGGSQGTPVPVTQFLQAPDIRTEQIEKTAIMPTGGTIVLGSWKETGERPARKGVIKKEKPATEYEVVVLVSVRVLRNDEPAVGLAPAPHEVPARVTKVFNIADLVIPNKPGQSGVDATAEYRRNVGNIVKVVTGSVRPGSWDTNGGRGQAEYFDIGCALVVTNTLEVVNEVGVWLNGLHCLPRFGAFTGPLNIDEPAPDKRLNSVHKLKYAAAADTTQAIYAYLQSKTPAANQKAVLVAEPVANTVLISAEPALYEEILTVLASIDKAPPQVTLQTMVVQVPRGFAARYGLLDEGAASGTAVTLSPREAKMLTGLIRAARECNECEILSRPELCVSDNQSGVVRVGQEVPVQTLGLVKSENGTALEPKTEYVPTGLSMRFTPRVCPDGTSVLVTAELESTTVSHTVLTTGAPGSESTTRVPVFNTGSVRAVSQVRLGQTMLVVMAQDTSGSFTGMIRRLLNRDQDETLVVITPHLPVPADPVRPAGEIRK